MQRIGTARGFGEAAAGIVLLAAVWFGVHGLSNHGATGFGTSMPDRGHLDPAPAYRNMMALPMYFEAGTTRTGDAPGYRSHGPGYSVLLTADEAVMNLHHSTQSAVLRTRLIGARTGITPIAEQPQAGYSNYMIGGDAAQWHSRVAHYGQVRYDGVYPGIDLIYHGQQRQLEYDFVVAPGAHPEEIRLAFSGARSAQLDADGNLVLALTSGEVVQHKPVVYQEIDGRRMPIHGSYQAPQQRDSGFEVGFDIGDYDRTHALVIDPVLGFATFMGGDDSDTALAVAADVAGNVYVAGYAGSGTFPSSSSAFDSSFNGGDDAFVAKFNATGTLAFITFLGGSSNDGARAIAVDTAGNIYVAGSATGVLAPFFPTTSGAYDTTPGPPTDGFIAKLDPSGTNLLYSTLLGGNGNDSINAIGVTAAGTVYVTGNTSSNTGFPTTAGAYDHTFHGGTYDGFVAHLDATGSTLVYSTLLGGAGLDIPNGIAVDAAGNAYVGGLTGSNDFPTTAGAFGVQAGTNTRAFVTKLDPAGAALVYSGVMGGSGGTVVNALALDASGSAYIAGATSSSDFPTTSNAFDTTLNTEFGSHRDAFVVKLSPNGSALAYSTYLGAAGEVEYAWGIAVDAAGNAYVTGEPGSTSFPTTPLATGANCIGRNFLSELDAAGAALLYSTCFGSTNIHENGKAVALDGLGHAYIAGTAAANDFPVTPGAFQGTYGGGDSDAYVVQLTPVSSAPSPGVIALSSASYTVAEGESLAITVNRSGGSAGAASVMLATANDTATSGADYTASNVPVNFADGDTAAKVVNVPTTQDAAFEGAETFTVNLSAASGATLGSPASATATITDDDVAAPPSPGTLAFSATGYSVGESGGTVTITVNRTAGSAGTVTADYAAASNSATTVVDYTAAAGTLSWADGDAAAKTFSVAIVDDAIVEGAETASLTLSNPSGGATLGTAAATLTINDNDVAPPPPVSGNVPVNHVGGGAVDAWLLAALMLLVALRAIATGSRKVWPRRVPFALVAGLLAALLTCGTAANAGDLFAELSVGSAAIDWKESDLTVTSRDEHAVMLRVGGGWRFNDFLAVDLTYDHIGRLAIAGTSSAGAFEQHFSVEGGQIGVLGTWPLHANSALFGRIGAEYADVKSSCVEGGVDCSAHDRGFSAVLGGGARLKVGSRLDLQLEYDHVGDIGDSQKTGAGGVDVLMLGMQWHMQ